MKKLIHFNKAKQELAIATSIDEVKEIRDKAEALRHYAKQAGESLTMQNQCAEIKIRAERRAGELIPEKVRRPEEGRPKEGLHDEGLLLKDLDINETQSTRWQAIASIPEEQFESFIGEIKDANRELTSSSMHRYARSLHKVEAPPLPDKKYNVIYADPPWSYTNLMPPGTTDPSDYYPLMTLEEICNLKVKEIVTENAVLFLWVTAPILAESFEVIQAWGFKYKAQFIWDKIKHNVGHYNSVRHELLQICIRGSCPIQEKKLFDSVQTIERSGKHSQKPEQFRKIIETLYPEGKKIELFARAASDGWDIYGK